MSRVCYKCKGVGCPVGARTKDGLCEHCQPPPEKQECSCHEWTGREPRTYHCSHCSMRGMRINMPHQDEGMEWEEEIRYLFNNGGTNPPYAKSHIQYSDSKYPNQLTEELVIKTIKSLLAKDRIDTARKIARAAGQAGLSPRDLAKAEDWKEAIRKDRQQLRESIEELQKEHEVKQCNHSNCRMSTYAQAVTDCLAILEEEGENGDWNHDFIEEDTK